MDDIVRVNKPIEIVSVIVIVDHHPEYELGSTLELEKDIADMYVLKGICKY